jgi:hypothetical protein
MQESALEGTNLPVTVMKYQPFEKESDFYVLSKDPKQHQEVCKLGLPIPPQELWLG